MLETVIIGGGLCGLALAKGLQDEDLPFELFEARPRLGGRVLSAATADGSARFDLGPTWFWPEAQPLLVELLEALGMADFQQHDSGAVLALREANKAPEVAHARSVHAGARRVTGGMASVTEALANGLEVERLHLGHVLTAVVQRDDHVELHFVRDEESSVVLARRVVLAIPPRVLVEQVRFAPPLDPEQLSIMQATPTWMAAQAKAVLRYGDAAWRTAGRSGNAFVLHEQAVLGEIFDACDADAGVAALGGFLALSPALRRAFYAGLPLLLSNQIGQIFGSELQERDQLFQDWAAEPLTCSQLDLVGFDEDTAHPEYGAAELRQPAWEGRLYFGGSETAEHGGGYLEGALDAARRIRRALTAAAPEVRYKAASNA